MKSMKKLIALLLAFVLVFSLCACGGGNTAGNNTVTPTNNGGNENSAAPVKDTLKVIISQDSGTLDPMNNNGWDCIQALRMIYEPLWEVKSNNEINYVLATSFEMVEPARWIVHLREGVKFANGNDFNADDVLFSLTRANTREGSSALLPKLLHEECKKIDEYTVELHFDSYRVGLEYDTWSNILMVDKESFDENTITSKTNGTGPYEIEEMVTNSQWTLKARDGYWGDPAPFKTIIFQVLSEATQKVNAIETGSADICGVPFADIAYVQGIKTVDLYLDYTGQSRAVYFNISKDSFFYDNDDARKAVAMAIDRNAVVNIVYSGFADVSRLPVAQGKVDQEDSFLDIGVYKTGQNLEEAKKLAESSGLAGKEITLINNGSDEYKNICELIQSDLKKIGVTVKIRTLDSGSWKTVYNDPTSGWDFAVDFTMGSTVVRGYDMWSNMGGGYSFKENPFRGHDEFWDVKPKALVELDVAKRKPMTQQLTEILADSLIWYSLCDTQQAIAYNKDLKGFEVRKDGYIVCTNFSW